MHVYVYLTAHNDFLGANGLPVIKAQATAGKLTINGNGAIFTRGYRLWLPIIHRQSAGVKTIAAKPQYATQTGAAQMAASGDLEYFRYFFTDDGSDLTLNNVTLQDGSLPWNQGGAIFNAGTLNLNDATLTRNFDAQGGAIFNTGSLTVTGSAFTANEATHGGGGINSAGTLVVNESDFSNNSALVGDGILAASGTVTLGGDVSFADDTSQICPAFPILLADGDEEGLIQAIHCANNDPADNVINLASGGFYTLTAVDNGAPDDPKGLPTIISIPLAGKLIIHGNGATIERSTVFGTPAFRIPAIVNGDLSMDEVTIRNGFEPNANGGGIYIGWYARLALTDSMIANNTGGGIRSDYSTLILDGTTIRDNTKNGYGGGISFEQSDLTITDSAFINNYAEYDAGAMVGVGTVTIDNSLFQNNTGNNLCGGVLFGEGSTATINHTTFVDNKSINGMAGGAALLTAHSTTNITISNSTFQNNVSNGAGGAVFNGGVMTVTNSTFVDNYGVDGGGLWNGQTGTLTVRHSTIVNNEALWNAGGIINYGTLYLSHTILTGNIAGNHGPDLYTIPQPYVEEPPAPYSISNGYNLIGSIDGVAMTGQTSTDQTGVSLAAVQLGIPQNNGGPTFTMALGAGSIALDAGDPDFSGPPDYDQRGTGYPRVLGGRIDIGAYER